MGGWRVGAYQTRLPIAHSPLPSPDRVNVAGPARVPPARDAPASSASARNRRHDRGRGAPAGAVSARRERTDAAPDREAPGEPSDEALVRASAAGDDGAFTLLVRRYLLRAMAVAVEYVASREDAEDVVQDAFRLVAANLGRFDTSRPFGPWFFTIVRNTARNAARRRGGERQDALERDLASTAPGPFEDARRAELRRRIDAAVETLPPMQRTCFRLCVVEGLASAEAASATGVAESTVRVHVFKARRALQTLLASWRDEANET